MRLRFPQQDPLGRVLLWLAIVLYVVNLAVIAYAFGQASVQ